MNSPLNFINGFFQNVVGMEAEQQRIGQKKLICRNELKL